MFSIFFITQPIHFAPANRVSSGGYPGAISSLRRSVFPNFSVSNDSNLGGGHWNMKYGVDARLPEGSPLHRPSSGYQASL